MSHTRSLVVGCFATFVFLAGGAAGEDKQLYNKEAQIVANNGIAKLAAWRNGDARSYLQKNKAEFGETTEYQTAWALLEIQDGADGKKGMVASGLSSLSKMTKSASFDSAALYYHGEILYQENDRKGADAAWQAAAKSAATLVNNNPTDATAQFYLGAALVRSKRFAEAREALLLAVRGGFDPAMINHQIGLSYLFAQQWQEAKEAFDLGLSVDPRYAPMYFWRAMAWDKLGRKDNMLIDLDQYLKLAPNAPEAGKAKAVLKSAGR